MDIRNSKGRDAFRDAYRACAEEKRVPPDRSPLYVKLPAHRAGLPGHPVASRMRAKEVSFILCPFLPAGRQGPHLSRLSGTGHVPANWLKTLANFEQRKDKRSPEHGAPVFLEKNIIKKRAGTSR